MNFSFETQGNNTYLVYTVQPDEILDSTSMGMLTNNQIPGYAPALFTQLDTIKFIKYNITSKCSIKRLFKDYVNKKRLLGIFLGIIDGILSAGEYMIDPNSILLEEEYIYSGVSNYETILICLPIMDLSKEPRTSEDLKVFFKGLMFNMKFDQSENRDHVGEILNYLGSDEEFSLYKFKELLESMKTESKSVQVIVPKDKGAQPKVPKKVITDNEEIGKSEEIIEKIPPKESTEEVVEKEKKNGWFSFFGKKKKDDKKSDKKKKAVKPSWGVIPGVNDDDPESVDVIQKEEKATTEARLPRDSKVIPESTRTTFGETVNLAKLQSRPTTELGRALKNEKITPHLVWKKTNGRIEINKSTFHIGREPSYADFCIGNDAISGSHADIISRKGEYFIMDTNSTNHTYVDGKMIQSNEEVKLVHGVAVCLANEEFVFYTH